MKRISGLALASASLISLPLHAAAPDPAPTIATDAQGTTLTGVHHLNGAAFSLIVTDWWLSGTIANGQAQDVRLIVEVHLPQYPLLDRATDAAGRKLDVVILNRGPSARWRMKASERVAVVLPHDVAEKARTAGLSITVSGKDRSFPISVPADAMAHFLDAYAQAASGAGAAPAAQPPASVPPPPSTPVVEAPATQAPEPVPTPAPSASSTEAPATQVPAPQPAPVTPPVAASAPQPPAAPPAAAPPLSDDDDPAITPVPDTRVRLPDGSFAPGQAPVASPPPSPPPAPPAAAPSPPPPAASAEDMPVPESGGGHGVWVDSLGIQFVATSSGAMVLLVRPGSIAASKGIESGDFIEAVDGVAIKALTAPQMAAKIGAPGVKVLHMIAAGDVKIR
ncbi:hypothetical protein [Sphingomonas oryzagri]|uniref:PDZ domain-containing protein n=1 Tax=Sphingomonas oryzagri TaxID=3042314 RepID=A0ABT6N6N8_9SPHN|nr:hypothetical protein [Sphingomonas oryzagri]MDH7640756.1 hypothetical protein [Sphingomonas oryzagri]